MNIFYLDHKPDVAAKMHCDKHVCKMVIEYAQLMSTAHRTLDGEFYYGKTANGRKIARWKMDDPVYEKGLMKASHVNHPSAIWTRESNNNYNWLFSLWQELLHEYSYRYNRKHACENYMDLLRNTPINIPVSNKTQPPPAMKLYPQCIVTGDSVKSYRNYYVVAKKEFARWTNRSIPVWYTDMIDSGEFA